MHTASFFSPALKTEDCRSILVNFLQFEINTMLT